MTDNKEIWIEAAIVAGLAGINLTRGDIADALMAGKIPHVTVNL